MLISTAMQGATPIIEVRNLVKCFGDIRAVDGVDFSVNQGKCYGLLGPNGAGKTTTVEIMEGITQPTSGDVYYKGRGLDYRFKQEAGIQFQSTALQDYIKVIENLKLFRSFYDQGLEPEVLIELCSLQGFTNQFARQLSGGQRQRLLLALALVNDPQMVFLDEPTTGLDPQARRNFWDLITRIKGMGKTVLLTTHYMEEAYLLCDEIAIMDHGRIIARGSPEELLAEHFEDVVLELPESDFDPGDNFPIPVHRHNGRLEMYSTDVNEAIRLLLEQDVSLSNLKIRPRTLEDLFIDLTGKELRP